ncbi:MAG TPA: aldehyde dehydrogenase family protein [Gaiellaceae bacterium]|nr:aldehyde dehydrogenase family protein [Gaiellaceae bacterium]
MTDLREAVEREAAAAHAAVGALTDAGVAQALERAAELVAERTDSIAAANALDVHAASGHLDEGALDRLRLDPARIAALREQLAQLASLPPLERDEAGWELENGLRVGVRRIPIGAVGANFEARPNVAVDVAGQLLKSLNAAVLRTGGAALRTVTALVDEVLRPALEHAGLPPDAVGLVRSPERDGAHVLVSLPHVLPLVILRGSGATTAELAREAAQHGVRTLAHAEGGGVLYIGAAADASAAQALVEASLDRLGVCNRLNLLLIDRAAEEQLPGLILLLDRLGIAVREPERLGHEWANDPEHIASVTVRVVESLDEAVALANEETSGLAAAIATEDAAAAERFLSTYRGTAAFWNAPTRFTDGFALTGSPETGINVDRVPGPRGPVTYRDLWLRQYRVTGNGTQHR